MKLINSIFVLILFCISYSANAQFSVGITTGLQQSNMSIPSINRLNINFDANTTFSVGVVGQYKVLPNFAIQSELKWQQKGMSFNTDSNLNLGELPIPIGIRNELTFNYIEVPVLAKIFLGNNTIKGYGAIGPYVGYAASARLQSKATILVDLNLLDTPVNLNTIDYNRFEFGAQVGVGGEVSFGRGVFFLDVRYSRGFTDTNQIPVIDLNGRNYSVGLNTGMRIAI